MDTNNWRPAAPGGEPAMEAGDWRAQLPPDSRLRIVNKIMDTLKRHLPLSGQEGLQELQKIARRFEEKIYSAATNQSDYLRKISLKMLTMETKPQNSLPNSLPSNAVGNSNKTPDPGAALDSTAQTGHVNGGDWQEEVYQKIKAMRETYYPELNEMYQKIAAKLHLHESFPQQPKTEQYDKLKTFKSMLERTMAFLQLSKSNITPNMKDKLLSYEKQIITFINPNRPRKPTPSLQQGQLPQPHMQPVQQTQSQIPQVQSHENQMNPQLQTMNLQGSVPAMQQNNMSSLQHNPLSSVPGISTSQQMMNAIQPGSNLDSGQGNTLGSLQQMSMGSLQQNAVSAPQQANINTMSSQSGANMLPPNVPLQSNSTMLQHQHLKQQQEQQMLQLHQFKQQLQQRQLQQQLIKQQMQQQRQQLNQQAKQQLPAQMTQQMSQLHQMTDANELKMRQGIGIKPGVFPQHLPMGQRTAFPHQQMKSGGSYPISSPQLLPAASPQLPQHSAPQVEHQNLLPSLTKTGTPLQSANSPFIVPSPSTPLAPSPALQDSEQANIFLKRIEAMKDSCNPELNEMCQKVAAQSQQQTMMNAMQPASSLDLGQESALGLLPQISMGPLQLCPVSAPQQANINTLSSLGEVNMLQPTFPVQSNSAMLQQQHPKQQQEEHRALQTHLQQLFQQLQQSKKRAKTSVGDQQKIAVQTAASVAIETPDKSVTPLLAEFAGPDSAYGSTMATFSSKSSAKMHMIKALPVLFVMLSSIVVVLSLWLLLLD
uniref:Mediator of RNA polymerase II transcription subunit 15a-like n=2 Tax=Rhizophora mucronata TaxID=61149 RepID=A0A2P2MQK2_RHIMU